MSSTPAAPPTPPTPPTPPAPAAPAVHAGTGWRSFLSGGGLQSIALNAVLPLVAYGLLTQAGVGQVPALAAASVFPLFATVSQWVRVRQPDPIGLLSLVFIVMGIVASIATDDPLFVLLQGPASSAVFALLCFGSLALARPLMFYISRQLATGGQPAGMAFYDTLWQSSLEFRRTQRTITVVWGAVLAASALLGFVLAVALQAGLFLAAWQIITHGGTLALIGWTMAYNRRHAQADRAPPRPA